VGIWRTDIQGACEGTVAGPEDLKCPSCIHSAEDLDFILKLMRIPWKSFK
jgi:hypothetical protein